MTLVPRQKWTVAQNLGETTLSEQMISEVFLELDWANHSTDPKVLDLTAKKNFLNM